MVEDPIEEEIKHFISEKIEDPILAAKFMKDKDVQSEIERKVEEIWFEYITPAAEESAEEIIEMYERKLRELKEMI